MDIQQSFLLVFTVLGGLALFLFGMQLMTDGLRSLAGDRLRDIIYRSTGNRIAGLGLGTGLGFLMHSSATTAMSVGFINAGLLGLAQSIPVFMGANLGTTLSMQLISFRLADYALVAVATGFGLSLVSRSPGIASIGKSLLGFGLLFNGMGLMSGAIEPHRAMVVPWLTFIDGATWGGLVLGTLIAWLFTAVVQSSGATIGMTFVLISGGILTSLEQVYPIVLGAHLGTTTTAIIAATGCGIEARRGAAANFAFNVFNVGLALLAAPLFIGAVRLTSDNMVRQTANLHTAIMLVAALILLPFSTQIAFLIRRLLPSRVPVAPPSFLAPHLIPRPEAALVAVILEQRRSLDILTISLDAAREFALNAAQRRAPRLIRSNELAVNETRDAIEAYLTQLTQRSLSRRQRLLAQYLSHITTDVERIGDHIIHISDKIEDQRGIGDAGYDEVLQAALLELFDGTKAVLMATSHSFSPDAATFPAAALKIEVARDAFANRSQTIRQAVNDRVAEQLTMATAGLFFSRQALVLEELVRHCGVIAREQLQPFFSLNPSKLDRVEPPVTSKERPPRGDHGPAS